MIKHYFKIGFRNLLKYKTQSSISILGLAIGLTFFTVGYYWYRYETSYDSFYPESEHIYNIYTIDKQTGKMLPGAPVILCAELNENFPEVKYAATLSNAGGIYTSDNKTIGTPLFKWVNQSYTRLFPPKVIAGNITDPIPTTENGTKTNLMVTRRFALKYWKTPEEAIGKTLTDQNKFTQTITAVIENPPSNSIFQTDGYHSIQVDKSHYTSRSPEYYWNYPPNEMYVCLHENTAMGFDTDNLIQVNISSQIYSQFIDEIKQIPSITDCIHGGNFRLSHDNWHTEKEIGWENKPANASYEIQMFQAGIDFAQKMKITLQKGRYLEDTDLQSDDPSGIGCHKILINEQMAHLLGTTDPIGKMISRKDYILRGEDNTPPLYFEIVGVVKDFHGLSLRNPIPPTIIEYCNFYDHYLYLRTLPGKEKEALKAVKELINRITPEGFPLSETMTVNDQLEILTCTENASLRLFTLLAVLCALISIFGIYSISSSNMQQRKKEIAIRKVMGAMSREIIDMFLKEYTIITLAANAIALPVGYLFAPKWLEQYPQSVHIQLWMFISIQLSTILLVILTVLGQVVQAANGNPADVVKSD